MSKNPSSRDSGIGGVLVAVGAVGLTIVCCAGPALLASGGVALAGGALGMPLLLAIAALILIGAVVFTLARVRQHRGASSPGSDGEESVSAEADECCSSGPLMQRGDAGSLTAHRRGREGASWARNIDDA